MANTTAIFGSRFPFACAPTKPLLRIGRRAIVVCRDFRKRFYRPNRFIDCGIGADAGHLELLFFRRWLLILSRTR